MDHKNPFNQESSFIVPKPNTHLKDMPAIFQVLQTEETWITLIIFWLHIIRKLKKNKLINVKAKWMN